LIDYIIMCITYLYFYRALKVQGIDRRTLPYRGWGQPYCAWIGLVWISLVVLTYGYTTFLPGYWSIGTFFDYYLMIGVCPILYVFWKILKKTKVVKPEEADLVWDRPMIDQYEASFTEEPMGLWMEMASGLGLKRKKVTEVNI